MFLSLACLSYKKVQPRQIALLQPALRLNRLTKDSAYPFSEPKIHVKTAGKLVAEEKLR